MPKMAYFRRPQLAGKSLRRPSAPTLRGSLRRRDPDGSTVVPHFTALPSGGGTLTIDSYYDPTQPVASVTVTITASGTGVASLDAVLTALNSSLAAAKILAFDDGGCIGLMSASTYPIDSWFKVTGGTAAAALGFDITVQSFFAKSGDLKSAPEGRVGNPFGAAFPSPGENYDTETLSRALGRIMSNMDVLHSEHVREEVVVSKIASINGPLVYIDVNTFAVGQRVFTAGTPNPVKVLSPTSTQEELARFFYLMDPVTGQISQSAITKVTDVLNAEVLGVEKLVVSSTITEVPSGDTLRISGSTASVYPGDYVKITGADNGSWRNNGYRWVVEEVPAAGTLRVRPMSKVELEQVMEPEDESQPIVELCTAKAPGETYGTAAVYRSPFSVGVRLKAEPGIPSGATYDLYAAVPASTRSRLPTAAVDVLKPLFADMVRQRGMMPDAVLTAPTLVNGAGATIDIGEFYVRRRGKVVRIPASSSGAPMMQSGMGRIYFNPSYCSFWILGEPPEGGYWLLATVTVNPGNGQLVVHPSTKVDALQQGVVTVGASGCNFTTLAEAAQYARGVSQKTRILLIENQVLPAMCELPEDIIIEGATSDVRISAPWPAVASLFHVNTSNVQNVPALLSSLTVELASGSQTISTFNLDDLHLQNVVVETLSPVSTYRYYVADERVQVRDLIADASGQTQNSTVDVILKALNGVSSSRRFLRLSLNSLTLTDSSNLSTTIAGASVTTGTVSASGAVTGASVAATGDVTAGDDVSGLKGHFSQYTKTPLVSTRNAAAPSTVVYINVLEVWAEDLLVSDADAAIAIVGTRIDQGGTNYGWVASQLPQGNGTTLLGMNVTGSWSDWSAGGTATDIPSTDMSGAPLRLLGDGADLDGSVRIGNRFAPRVDGKPILRVANDLDFLNPMFDVTQNDAYFYPNWTGTPVQFGMKDIIERVVTTLFRVGPVGTDYPIFYMGTVDVYSNGGRPVIGALPVDLPCTYDGITPLSGGFGGIDIPIGSSLYSDNMDVMEYIEVEWYRQPAAINLDTNDWGGWEWPPRTDYSGAVYWLCTTKHACPGRLFADRQNFAAAENISKVTAMMVSENLRQQANASARPLVKITLVNRAGRSLGYWYYWSSATNMLKRMPSPMGPPPLAVPVPSITPSTVSLTESYAGEVLTYQFNSSLGGSTWEVRNTADSGPGLGTISAGGLYSSGNITSNSVDLVFATVGLVRSAPATVNRYNFVASGGTGGGGGGGGECPAAWVMIDLANGQQKRAWDLVVGDMVATEHENGRERGHYAVIGVRRLPNSPLKLLTTEDGRRAAFSPAHRFKIGTEWVALKDLSPGMVISGTTPGVVKSVTDEPAGPAVMIKVVDAHTYETSGLLSHNRKPVYNLQ